MIQKFLYFARYEHRGEIVWGGHFLAPDAALARLAAGEAFERDRGTSKAHGLRLGPLACECVLSVKRSNADVANAMNAP